MLFPPGGKSCLQLGLLRMQYLSLQPPPLLHHAGQEEVDLCWRDNFGLVAIVERHNGRRLSARRAPTIVLALSAGDGSRKAPEGRCSFNDP